MLKYTIKGPHCKSCIALIEDVLEEMHLKPIKLELNKEQNTATLEVAAGDANTIAKTIAEETGYEVVQE